MLISLYDVYLHQTIKDTFFTRNINIDVIATWQLTLWLLTLHDFVDNIIMIVKTTWLCRQYMHVDTAWLLTIQGCWHCMMLCTGIGIQECWHYVTIYYIDNTWLWIIYDFVDNTWLLTVHDYVDNIWLETARLFTPCECFDKIQEYWHYVTLLISHDC